MKTIKVNWTQYHELVDKLAEQIKKSGKEYKAVYSPDNPMLAFLLSKEFGIELLEAMEYYNGFVNLFNIDTFHYNEVLVVSDIINIGKTREQYKDFDFGCIYCRLIQTKDFLLASAVISIKELDKDTKVVMPWEGK